jgi:hypothetical protein
MQGLILHHSLPHRQAGGGCVVVWGGGSGGGSHGTAAVLLILCRPATRAVIKLLHWMRRFLQVFCRFCRFVFCRYFSGGVLEVGAGSRWGVAP